MFEQLSLFQENPYKEYCIVNKTSDDELCEFIDYLTFKCWLYYNFPMFEGKEVKPNVWQIFNGKKSITIQNGRCYIDTNKQFISVGYEIKGYGGWSRPCDTLFEVREAIENALNDFKGRG